MGSSITDYSDGATWEAWQADYRFGVLLIFPPPELLERANRIRAAHDPRSQASCDAHISLTIPLPRAIRASHWAELERVAAALAPFPIEYGPLKTYLPHPGVCLEIRPASALGALRKALEATSVFEGAEPRRWPYSPHLTLAEFISVPETERLALELEPVAPLGRFVCDAVAYAVPDDDFHFERRRVLRLGGGLSASASG